MSNAIKFNKEINMKNLDMNEIQAVSGGCREHCWGDFQAGGLAAAAVGGGMAGMVGGPVGMGMGMLSASVTYLLTVAWSDA